jgi:hypothetical protein
MLAPEELQALADDIKEKGQLEAIVLYDGQVLDGRNRLAACELAGVEPRTITMGFRAGEIGPTEWVISKNLHRRQLTASQAAMVAIKALPLLEQEMRDRQVEAGRNHGAGQKLSQIVDKAKPDNSRRSAAQAGLMFGVNRQYVSDAKQLDAKAPELAEAVRVGDITIPEAKREVKKRETRKRLAEQFAERELDKPLVAVDAQLAERADEIHRAAGFYEEMDRCISRLLKAMPGSFYLRVTDAQQASEIDRIADALESIARKVRDYKGEVNG